MGWRDRAGCRGEDLEVFYTGDRAGEAKRLCGGCPVRADCLEEAVLRGDRHAVLGGLTAGERRELLRIARQVAA